MNKLVILMSAASALVPASAMAQRTAAPPVRWEDTPHAQMRMPAAPMPPASGMNWHGQPGAHQMPPAPPAPGMSWHGQSGGHQMPPPPRPDMRPYPGPHGPGGPGMAMHHRGDRMMMMRHHGVRNFSRYQRFNRGGFLPQIWWGPQFQISNWSRYGLPQPMPGCRWMRYYDDALMVDGAGRIIDGRWGMNWDRWGNEWDYGPDGAPIYVGDGDYYGEEDYAWGGEGRGYGYGPPPPPPGYGAPCAQTCTSTYAYPGYGYGWGWGYGAGMVVTETTVTTSPSVVTETIYEEEVVRERSHRAKARHYRPRPRYHRPVPQPGERG